MRDIAPRIAGNDAISRALSLLPLITTMSNEKRLPSQVLPNALAIPASNKMHGKRIVLASASPRRKQILETFVRVVVVGHRSPLTTPGFAGSEARGRCIRLCRGLPSFIL